MPNLGVDGERIVRAAARRLDRYGDRELAGELRGLADERPLPTIDEVPERLEETVADELAYTRGDRASEEWARKMVDAHRTTRAQVWAVLRTRPERGVTAREVVRILRRDPGESLNSIRRVLQEFYSARLVEKHGTRVLTGRETPETVRRLSEPVRTWYRLGAAAPDGQMEIAL